MNSKHTINRRGFILLSSASAASMLLSGCNTGKADTAIPLAVEPLGATTKRELGEKYLHHHSLMQQLMWLGAKDRFRVTFKSGSDDVFVSSAVPDNWSKALLNAKAKDGILIDGNLVGKKGEARVLDITDSSSSIFSKMLNESITPEVFLGDGLSGKYITQSDRKTREIFDSSDFTKGERLPLKFIFDKLYGVGAREGTDVFFSYSPKTKVIKYTTTPHYFYLTPYKRQLFVNYLDSLGIGYISNGDGIALKDNFTNWVSGMNKLRRINKYRFSVYGIFDGTHFFEVTDSNYRDAPITVELIDWTPDGKREYNVYCNGYHRKVVTDKRFHSYYTPDGSKKYILRFY